MALAPAAGCPTRREVSACLAAAEAWTIALGHAGGGWPGAEEGARRRRQAGPALGRGPPHRPSARQAVATREGAHRMGYPSVIIRIITVALLAFLGVKRL